jgi:hypothetical protein
MSPSVNHPLSSRAALVPAMLVGAASINAAGTVAFSQVSVQSAQLSSLEALERFLPLTIGAAAFGLTHDKVITYEFRSHYGLNERFTKRNHLHRYLALPDVKMFHYFPIFSGILRESGLGGRCPTPNFPSTLRALPRPELVFSDGAHTLPFKLDTTVGCLVPVFLAPQPLSPTAFAL